MPNNRYRDFDQFLREKRAAKSAEPVTFTIGGVLYTLPAELPALVAVEALRLQKAGVDGDVPADSVLSLATALFGGSQLKTMLQTGISLEELGDIIGYVMEQYSPADAAEETDSKNALSSAQTEQAST